MRTYKTREHAARAYAKHIGLPPAEGGWIYEKENGRPVCQGFSSYALVLETRGRIRPAEQPECDCGFMDQLLRGNCFAMHTESCATKLARKGRYVIVEAS